MSVFKNICVHNSSFLGQLLKSHVCPLSVLSKRRRAGKNDVNFTFYLTR